MSGCAVVVPWLCSGCAVVVSGCAVMGRSSGTATNQHWSTLNLIQVDPV